MSKNLAQLCSLLIEDVYGPLYSHIFSTLTEHGRMSAGLLAQKCRLPQRQVRPALAALGQLRLVYFRPLQDGRTAYEANTSVAYDLARFGKFMHAVAGEVGGEAAATMSRLLTLGDSTAKQIQAYGGELPHAEAQPVLNHEQTDEILNSTNDGHCGRTKSFPSTERLKPAGRAGFLKLSQYGYLMAQRPIQHRTGTKQNRESDMDMPPATAENGQTDTNPKALQDMKNRTVPPVPSTQRPENAKRGANDDITGPVSKKQKAMGNAEAEDLKQPATAVADQIVHTNFYKLNILLRNIRMTYSASRRKGKLAARVLASALQQVGSRPWRCEGSQVQVDAESGTLDDSWGIDVGQLLLAANATDALVSNGNPYPEQYRNAQTVNHGATHPHSNDHVNGREGSVHQRLLCLEDIEAQLLLLSEGPDPFVSWDKILRKWTINLQNCMTQLRRDEILHVVGNRFGQTALRVFRILIDKGKVEEKILQEIGLLAAKDLRQTLANLKTHGFLDLQEVPREPQRQPARTMYLWFYDQERVRMMTLETVYKSMARILQRLKTERREVNTRLDQTVQLKGSNEADQKFLSSSGMDFLKLWGRKERWLVLQLNRLDESVAILS